MKENKRGRDVFKTFGLPLNMLSSIFSVMPLAFRKWILIHARYYKGLFGIGVRYALLKSIAAKCGRNVSIHESCYIIAPEKLSVGDNVSIHPMCYLDANGWLEIGNDVSIAHSVSVLSTEHNYQDNHIPIKDQGMRKDKVVICDNVWIGAKAILLAGIIVHSGSIVAAGAVVTHHVNENEIVAGVPGKKIKNRLREETESC